MEETDKKNIFDLFSELKWSDRLDIDRTQNKISILDSGDVIFLKKDGINSLSFFVYNDETKEITKRSHPNKLEFADNVEVSEIVEFWDGLKSSGYVISFRYSIFRKILQISENAIEKIKVSREYKSIKIDKKKREVLVPLDKFLEIKSEAEEIDKIGTRRKYSIERYLINKDIERYLNVKIKDTTTVESGDFAYLIDRFNLKSKKTIADFKKYLSDADMDNIVEFTDVIIRKKIFPEEYLRRLDEYFIKEKLDHILNIGNKIISLKSKDVKTDVAKKVINLFAKGTEIKQLESIWQEFFKENLLYLIFSYKKIIPKIELDVEGVKKKFPDFIGVNHYNGVDVIEIKTHLKNVLVWDDSHENFAFSSEMSKAIVQTLNYLDAIARRRFKKEDDKKEILENLTEQENLYNPRGIIVISSKDHIVRGRSKLSEEQEEKLKRDFTKLRNSIQNIEVLTFDEVLGIAEKYTENIRNNYE